MQLDRVRRDPRLAVVEVEEGNPGDAGSSAEADVAPCDAHLAAPVRGRVSVAVRLGCLRDHVIAALLEHDVQVAVVLWPHEHHRGNDRRARVTEAFPVTGRIAVVANQRPDVPGRCEPRAPAESRSLATTRTSREAL